MEQRDVIWFWWSGICGKEKTKMRRDRFLSENEAITAWVSLLIYIAPCYPVSGKRGDLPIGIERILSLYIAQQCFSFSDKGTARMPYTIAKHTPICWYRSELGSGTGCDDSAEILPFAGSESIFDVINAHLAEHRLFLREGTIVDATLISWAPSTKNKERVRDTEMDQTKKGKQWHFDMKIHIGVDAQSGLAQTLIRTAANVHDVTQAQALLHGDKTDVFGEVGYQGVEKREENFELPVTWHIAMRPSKCKADCQKQQ